MIQDELIQKMNQVTNAIHDLDDRLANLWFEFELGDLSVAAWGSRKKKRIMLDGKPLGDHKFETKLRYLKTAFAFTDAALKEACEIVSDVDETLDFIGNRAGGYE